MCKFKNSKSRCEARNKKHSEHDEKFVQIYARSYYNNMQCSL